MAESPHLTVSPVPTPRQSFSNDHDSGNSQEDQHLATKQPLLSPNTAHTRRSSAEIIAPVPRSRSGLQHSKAVPSKLGGRYAQAMEWLEAGWALEAILLLCSAVCMAVIITFLYIHHDKPLRGWTFYFSLNTIISTLGTLFRSTLLMAVSAALAQGKWTWFTKRNSPLSTFEAIDAGSRETIGSFKLLWHMKGQHLVSAGAVVMALGFMVEPFLQAIISDEGSRVKSNPLVPATIGKSELFSGGTQCITPRPRDAPNVSTVPDFAISAALFEGLNIASGGDNRSVSFSCASGNCTWPEYISIAVCSSCFDVSDNLKKKAAGDSDNSSSSTYGVGPRADSGLPFSAFPDRGVSSGSPFPTPLIYGTQLPAVTPVGTPSIAETIWSLEHSEISLTNLDESLRSIKDTKNGNIARAWITADQNQTINFKDSQTMLAAFTILRAEEGYIDGSISWPDAKVTATECALKLCLNRYNATVLNGTLHESIVASSSEKVPKSWLPMPAAQQAILRLTPKLTNDNGTLGFNPVYHKTFLYRDDYQLLNDFSLHKGIGSNGNYNVTQQALLSTIDFFTSLIPQTNGDESLTKVVASTSGSGKYNLEHVYGSPLLQPLSNSTNLTAMFETIAMSLSNALRNTGQSHQQGDTFEWVSHFQVRWAFLALPLSLMTIGTIFLILSIHETHKHKVPTWKSSSIAVMVHGPDPSLHSDMRTQTYLSSLKAAAELQAHLGDLADGKALMASQQIGGDISRPRTPSRDEEEVEMTELVLPTTPRTPGSAVTLVEPQNLGGTEPRASTAVSLEFSRPEWGRDQVERGVSPLQEEYS